MPRNGSGSYSLPEPPFVPLTTISSAAMNSDLSDIASAMTASLARDGQGGMTAVLPLNASGFSYTNDTNTGMYRTGSDAQAIKCGGTDVFAISTTGAGVTGDLSVSGSITGAGGSIFMPPGVILPYGGSSVPTGWLLCYGQAVSRTTYAALFAAIGTSYGSGDGSTTFNVPDMRGNVPAGRDNMGGVAAGRLTATTITPNGSTPGGTGGAETVTLSQGNLPNVNFTVSGITLTNGTFQAGGISFGVNYSLPPSGGTSSYVTSGSNQFPLNSTSNVTVASQGTAASGGSGTAVNKVQPTIITNYIIFAGA